MALQHGFQHYQTIIPLEKAKPSTQQSTQVNPAPDQQAKPSTQGKAPSKRQANPALVTGQKRQAKQTQQAQKASKKQWAKLRP